MRNDTVLQNKKYCFIFFKSLMCGLTENSGILSFSLQSTCLFLSVNSVEVSKENSTLHKYVTGK